MCMRRATVVACVVILHNQRAVIHFYTAQYYVQQNMTYYLLYNQSWPLISVKVKDK